MQLQHNNILLIRSEDTTERRQWLISGAILLIFININPSMYA